MAQARTFVRNICSDPESNVKSRAGGTLPDPASDGHP
jgi:hypothetical protein